VAVAVVMVAPSAKVVDDGERPTVMFAAGPAIWENACDVALIEDVASEASTVVWPMVVETVNETLQVPLRSVVHVCCEPVAPVAVIVTLSFWTAVPDPS
jgi:hypothetical protein